MISVRWTHLHFLNSIDKKILLDILTLDFDKNTEWITLKLKLCNLTSLYNFYSFMVIYNFREFEMVPAALNCLCWTLRGDKQKLVVDNNELTIMILVSRVFNYALIWLGFYLSSIKLCSIGNRAGRFLLAQMDFFFVWGGFCKTVNCMINI